MPYTLTLSRFCPYSSSTVVPLCITPLPVIIQVPDLKQPTGGRTVIICFRRTKLRDLYDISFFRQGQLAPFYRRLDNISRKTIKINHSIPKTSSIHLPLGKSDVHLQMFFKNKLEYCFAREKKIVFAQQKQSVPMSINQFVEMSVFLCLICFSIYDKMQGFLDESGFFIFFFFFFLRFAPLHLSAVGFSPLSHSLATLLSFSALSLAR